MALATAAPECLAGRTQSNTQDSDLSRGENKMFSAHSASWRGARKYITAFAVLMDGLSFRYLLRVRLCRSRRRHRVATRNQFMYV